MKIVVCPNCGRKIHAADKCLFCGNDNGFQEISGNDKIHENVFDEYGMLEDLLKKRAFDEMIEKSRIVLRWMPTKSDIFWLRVLAKSKCTNDAELVQRGIRFDESADYYNAQKYASPDEQEVYVAVYELVGKIQNEFQKAVTVHEYEEKKATPIVRTQLEFEEELSRRRRKLFDLWSEIEKIEQEMTTIEQNCRLLISEHIDTLNSAKTEATYIKNQSYKLNECRNEELHSYQVRLGNILSQSDRSKNEVEAMKKQHPWVSQFAELEKKRNQLCGTVSSELSDLKSYKSRIQSTVSEIERIEKRHQLAGRTLAGYDFQSMYSLLGARKYEEVLRISGLAVIVNNRNASHVG